jgi:hypothetical protein
MHIVIGLLETITDPDQERSRFVLGMSRALVSARLLCLQGVEVEGSNEI